MICTVLNTDPTTDVYWCSTNFYVNGNYPPNGTSQLSFDIYMKDGSAIQQPDGPRNVNFGITAQPVPTPTVLSDPPTSTPMPSDGVQICSATNYGSPCETFTYTSHDTCIGLDQVAGYNRSVRLLGSYTTYSVVMYHDRNCGTYLARYGSSISDIGSGLYDQFSSLRLEQPSVGPPASATDVSLCKEANLVACVSFPLGQYPSLIPQGVNWPVLSLRVPSNRTLFVYNQPSLTGNRGTFDNDDLNLQADGRDTTIKSIIVEAKTSPNATQTYPANGAVLPACISRAYKMEPVITGR